MANCRYCGTDCPENGEHDRFFDCGLYTERKQKPQTNADRIRGMSDEEMAVWLVGATVCERVCDEDEYCHGNECVERVTRWLKQPAKEVHDGQTI